MKKAIKPLILMYIVVLAGCRQSLPKREYAQYITNTSNGLNKTVSAGDFEYDIQFRPIEYVALSEQLPDEETKERIKQLEGSMWFNVSLQSKSIHQSPMRIGISNEEDYEKRYRYFRDSASQNFCLIYGEKDTLKPVAFQFENNFNLTPMETIVVGFSLPNGIAYPEANMQLCYEDRVFNKGIIKALFSKSSIKNLPIPELNK